MALEPMFVRIATGLGLAVFLCAAPLCVSAQDGFNEDDRLSDEENSSFSHAPQTLLSPAVPSGRVATGPVIIEVEMLGVPELDDAGLSSTEGGLGRNLWNGTSRATIEQFLPSIPVSAPSPAQNDLTRRFLLTAAVTPPPSFESPSLEETVPDRSRERNGLAKGVGTAPSQATIRTAPPRPRSSLLATRLSRLTALGAASDVARFVEQTPTLLQNEGAARALLETRLLPPMDARFNCAEALQRSGDFATAWWQKLRLYCQFKAEERDAALIGVDMLRESKEKDDLFFHLADALLGYSSDSLRILPELSPLNLAMIRLANLALPEAFLATEKTPAISAALARWPDVDPEWRLEAGERAATVGALSIPELTALYQTVPFTSAMLERLLESEGQEKGAMTRALLFQGLATETRLEHRLKILVRFINSADSGRLAGPIGAWLLSFLNQIEPQTDYAAAAAAIARLHFAQGQIEAGRAWWRLAAQTGDGGAAVKLWPLAMAARSSEDIDVDAPSFGGSNRDLDLSSWLERSLAKADAIERRRVADTLALLEALGVSVEDSVWTQVLTGAADPIGALPSPVLWQNIVRAAEAKRTGETLLLGLTILGNMGPGRVPPIVAARVVSCFRRVGLDLDARMLGREAMIALSSN
ncbi:putative CHAT domain-containing protein [Azospirillaceae bacterium]